MLLLPLLLLPLTAVAAEMAATSAAEFEVALAKGPLFVKFFAPWCQHCTEAAPVWEEVKKKLEPATVIKVDCTKETALCARYTVTGYPTFAYVTSKTEMTRYRGARTGAMIVSWALGRLTGTQTATEGEVLALTSESFEEALSRGHTFVKFYAPWCTHCKRLEPVWAELAGVLSGRGDVTIAKVDCTLQKALCNEHGVKGYPTLLWFARGTRSGQKYASKRTLESLKNFVIELANKEKKATAGASASHEDWDSPAPQAPSSPVTSLAAGTFEGHVAADRLTLVKFFAPWCGHCKAMAGAYVKLAETVDPAVASVAEVDCSVEDALCDQQQVPAFPTLVLYRAGQAVATYEGDRSTADMTEFIREHVEGRVLVNEEKEEL